jgi:hypothetical protein
MQSMTPNLFILGAAKCGTTSLHDYLGQHPEIHAVWWKEPTFFNWPFQNVRNPLQYFKLFDSPKRFRLDSSVAYLVNPATPPVLSSLFPHAKFIVSLRHPKARAYSLYRNNRFGGWEEMPTFLEALKAEAGRSASAEFLQTCRWDFWIYLYCRSSLYDEQLARYFELFDREQFHIINLADLSRDPIGTTERTVRFLGLDPSPVRQFNFEIMNRHEAIKPTYEIECDEIMDLAFEGLTERTERLVGHAIDWSL